VLELNPDDVDAHANLGVVYYRMARLNDAVARFQAGLDIRPNDAALHYLLGAARLQMGDMIAARQSFEKARSLNPDLPEVYFGLGMLNKLENRREEAIANFEHFLKIGPGQDPQAKVEAEKQLNELKAQ
jgi:Flp pilus assembly protein TadD